MLLRRGARSQFQDASGKGATAKAWLSSLHAGMVVGILFVDEDLFHERMLLWLVDSAGGPWMCFTPDSDVYAGMLRCEGGEESPILGFLCGEDGSAPPKAAGQLYRFTFIPVVRRCRLS